MNVKKDILWRVMLSVFALGLFGVAVVYFIFRIQFVEGAHWRELSDSLTTKHQEILAVRGSIYSDKGDLLATSLPYYKISLDFSVIHDRHKDSFERYIPFIAKNLHQSFKNRSESEYEKLLRKEYRKRNRYFLLTRNATYLQVKAMKTWPIFKSGRYKGGMITEERTIRQKPYGDILHRTIGFVNENGRGAGIEASFNQILAGVSGKVLVQKISGGYRPLNDEYAIEPQDGKDIYTTINVEMQDIVHQALLRRMEQYNASIGCAILMEVKTGQIKAMANLNKTPDGYKETFNHAVGTLFEPGSTSKLISSIALLKGNHIEPEDSVDIEYGETHFYDRKIEDSDKGKYAKLTFQQVFELSSNVGTAKSVHAAFSKKPEDFLKIYDDLQLSQTLDLGIKGAGTPNVLRPNSGGWSGTALPSLSIGYSMQITPLHVAMLYNAVANNGRMVKPYLISGIGNLGRVETAFDTEVMNNSICSSDDIQTLQSFLRGVVERGTAKNLQSLPFPVSGKTGTARIANSGSYGGHLYNASFAGYFPSDAPKYTCFVLISEPRGAYYGSQVAAPVFEEIARKIYAKAVPHHLPKSEEVQLPAYLKGQLGDLMPLAKAFDFEFPETDSKKDDWVSFQIQNGSYIQNTNEQSDGMPDLMGLGLRDVLYLMENRKYKVRFSGYGKVKEQSPDAGMALRPGQTIYIRLGL
jgi:cell division protein FtsI (penicillin-binding protein 3)